MIYNIAKENLQIELPNLPYLFKAYVVVLGDFVVVVVVAFSVTGRW